MFVVEKEKVMDINTIEELLREADENDDRERLIEISLTLLLCLQNSNRKEGFVVIHDKNVPYVLFSGSFGECFAFVEGYETAPSTDWGDPGTLCICIRDKRKPIVMPAERFGENLGK